MRQLLNPFQIVPRALEAPQKGVDQGLQRWQPSPARVHLGVGFRVRDNRKRQTTSRTRLTQVHGLRWPHPPTAHPWVVVASLLPAAAVYLLAPSAQCLQRFYSHLSAEPPPALAGGLQQPLPEALATPTHSPPSRPPPRVHVYKQPQAYRRNQLTGCHLRHPHLQPQLSGHAYP